MIAKWFIWVEFYPFLLDSPPPVLEIFLRVIEFVRVEWDIHYEIQMIHHLFVIVIVNAIAPMALNVLSLSINVLSLSLPFFYLSYKLSLRTAVVNDGNNKLHTYIHTYMHTPLCICPR